MGSIPVCLIPPELLSAPKAHTWVCLAACPEDKASALIQQQVGKGQPIYIPQSWSSRDTAQLRECQVQWETLRAGGNGGALFAHHQRSGTVGIVSGRPLKCTDSAQSLRFMLLLVVGIPEHLSFCFPFTLVLSSLSIISTWLGNSSL